MENIKQDQITTNQHDLAADLLRFSAPVKYPDVPRFAPKFWAERLEIELNQMLERGRGDRDFGIERRALV